VTQQEKMQAAENEVIAARASSEAKSEFLSRMSHDIRTPLNAIIGFESLALGEDDMPPAVREYLEKIDVSGRYLLGLVNDVLDMEKIESGKLEIHEESTDRLKMLNSIADVFGHQAAEKGIKLTADFSSLARTVGHYGLFAYPSGLRESAFERC
jgi:signal transduction histidine kinase